MILGLPAGIVSRERGEEPGPCRFAHGQVQVLAGRQRVDFCTFGGAEKDPLSRADFGRALCLMRVDLVSGGPKGHSNSSGRLGVLSGLCAV